MLRSLVRPTLALAFGGAFIVGFLLGRISEDMFVAITATIIAYWFGSRSAGKV